MGDRGFPTRCRCGETVKMGTSRTAKNPGRLFHSCPNGSAEDRWFHTFKWTDECMVEEIEDLKLQMNNLEEDSRSLQKSYNACESVVGTLQMENRVCEAVVENEMQECKIELRSLKNMIGCVLVLLLVYMFMF
ncbi:Zinc finger GRF-type [Arabidopsis suecica]|uniref:Zinc finger GRF-type n=1 Tax=Arabidopsis suecica TaxID=45249 RepID=A0A8T1XRU5_ARASU|nr:Zinc finger GRF-type [Arabidopsis suecica]